MQRAPGVGIQVLREVVTIGIHAELQQVALHLLWVDAGQVDFDHQGLRCLEGRLHRWRSLGRGIFQHMDGAVQVGRR